MSEGATGRPLTVTGKRWDPRRLEYVAEYRCGACGGTFRRRFREAYPRTCPRCNGRLREVRGEIGGKRAWTR